MANKMTEKQFNFIVKLENDLKKELSQPNEKTKETNLFKTIKEFKAYMTTIVADKVIKYYLNEINASKTAWGIVTRGGKGSNYYASTADLWGDAEEDLINEIKSLKSKF